MAELQHLVLKDDIKGSTGVGVGTSVANFSFDLSALPLFCNIQNISLSYGNWAVSKSGAFGSISKKGPYLYYKTDILDEKTEHTLFNGGNLNSELYDNNTLHSGRNLISWRFEAQVSSAMYYVKSNSVSDVTVNVDYYPLDNTIKLQTKIPNQEPINFIPSKDNVSFTGTIAEDRKSATITYNTLASPPGYRFLSWDDGVTALTRTISLEEDGTYTVLFEPIDYKVEFYDITSGSEVLVNSMDCKYGTSYEAPSLPTYSGDVPAGKEVNNIYWSLSKDNICIDADTYYPLHVNSENEMTSVKLSPTFSDLTTVDGRTVKAYFGIFASQYHIYYKTIKNDNSIADYLTSVRAYGINDIVLENLPTQLTKGHKWSNQLEKENGPIVSSLSNSWFTSNMATTPTDEKISTISNDYIGDITVYCKEVPINYYVKFIIYDYDGQTIVDTLEADVIRTYGETYNKPTYSAEHEGRTFYGWYQGKYSISTWYIDKDGKSKNVTLPPTTETFSDLVSTDYGTVLLTGYLIPKEYTVNYEWISEYNIMTLEENGENAMVEDTLPAAGTRIYGRDSYEMPLIPEAPSNEDADVENVGTVKWYYEENGERVMNTEATISNTLAENRTFYAIKTLKLYEITFASNNNALGNVLVETSDIKENNLYSKGDIIHVHVIPESSGYFFNWSDGNNLPIRTITVENTSYVYIANFKANSILCSGITNLYYNNQPVKTVYYNNKLLYTNEVEVNGQT